MKRLEVVLVTLLIATLTFGALGCAEEEVTPTPTATVKSTPTPTPAPPGNASFRFYGVGEQGPGDGIYTVTVIDADTTRLEGKVLLEGSPIGWPTTWEWPSDYPPLQAGKVLVILMSSTSVDSYLYCSPSQRWQQDNPKVNVVFGGVDVYYYCRGYVVVKFENVPIVAGKDTVLPEVTLVPGVDEWVFYTEEGASTWR